MLYAVNLSVWNGGTEQVRHVENGDLSSPLSIHSQVDDHHCFDVWKGCENKVEG